MSNASGPDTEILVPSVLVQMPISSKIRLETICRSISPLLSEDEDTHIDDDCSSISEFQNEMEFIDSLASWGKDILNNDVAKIEEIIEKHSLTRVENNYEKYFKKKKPKLQLVTKFKKPKQLKK